MRARKHSFSRWFRNAADDNAAAAPRSDAVHAAVMETLESRRLLSAGLVPRQPPLPMATTSFFFPRRPPKPPAAPAAPARAEADALSASAARVTWLDQSSNEQGFRIDAAERRKPFKPVATADANATAVVVPDLKADTPYTFRVSALGNGSKSRAATTTGEPLVLELTSAEADPMDTPGWFKFTTGNSSPTRGEAAFTATGAVLPGTGWYYGSNWREAALSPAATGVVIVTDPSTNATHTWVFGSGPFRVGTGEQLEREVRETLPPNTPTDSSLRFQLPADDRKLLVLDDQWVSPDRDYDDFYWDLGVEKLTVVDVKWVAINSPLDPNTQQNGGQRMFPDKNTPTDTVARNTVTVEATLSHTIPPLQSIPVYFRSYDPDDPYPDSTGEIDENGNDLDNIGTTPGQRGTFPAAGINYGTSAPANTAGVASVMFQVTMQPGDNFRIGAALVNAELDPLDSHNNLNAVPADNTQVATFPGKLTNLLTVWRRLWVERDTMTTGTPGSMGVTLKSVTSGTGTAGDTVIFAAGVDLEGVDEYEGGTLSIPSMGLNLPVYKSTDNSLVNDSVRVTGGAFTAAQITTIAAGGVTGTLTDDDAFTLPHLPSGGTLIHSAFGNAYIKPEYVDGGINTRTTVTFKRFLKDDRSYFSDRTTGSLDLPQNDSLFWSTQIVGCWENKPNTDGDSDGIAASVPGAPSVEAGLFDYGWAGPSSSSLNSAAIFLETIDDVKRGSGAGATTDEAHTVVHEIAHDAGTNINGHGEVDDQGITTDWNGIMRASAPKSANHFDNIHLRFMREVATW